MIHLTANIFGPDEPVARWVLDDWEDNATLSTSLGLNVHGWVDEKDWFSRGGMVFQANLQNPVLAYLRRHGIPAAHGPGPLKPRPTLEGSNFSSRQIPSRSPSRLPITM